MKIYTRTGDKGTTSLFGGARVPKHHLRIDAYGTVDELNAVVGLVRSHLRGLPVFLELDDQLDMIQHDLFVLGADLATPLDAKPFVPRIEEALVERLEGWIDRYEADLPELKHFILPGGSIVGSSLHLVRTVARRAERLTVHAAETLALNPGVVKYLNRLSDLAFVLSRWVNLQEGVAETRWIPNREPETL